ncbi:MAG: Transcriptional regulator, MarR family [Verrucomicrobia bacterium]|nr:Transcriptional regulator, MarR family [Verrucomicrobiota bacterium]
MQRTAEATAINNLNHPLGFIVNRTAYIIRVRMREKLKREGYSLTPEELAIIHHLWQEDGQTQSQLANSTIRERTTTTRILDGLVRKGLVERRGHPDDRRKVCAWLTKKGLQLRDRLLPVALQMAKHGTSGLSAKDIEITMRTLSHIQNNLLKLDLGAPKD